MTGKIFIYRYGHRPARDKRITTHVALTARAFGAEGILIDSPDKTIEEGVKKVTSNFGGQFSIETGISLERFLSKGNKFIHLTMYGVPLSENEERIRKLVEEHDPVYIFVGAEKVPGVVYSKSSINISVTNQPISEVSALALLMDRIFQGKELAEKRIGSTRVIPNERGKTIEFVPDKPKCLEMLKNHGASSELIEHSLAVEFIADRICNSVECDYDIVVASALLHDIGRTVDNSIRHSVEGKKILQRERVSKKIQDAVLKHIGGGLTPEEVKNLGLPEEDMMPSTVEEKIVCTADNLIKGNQRISIRDQIERYKRKGLGDAAKRIEKMYEEICNMAGFDIDGISLWNDEKKGSL